MRNTCAGLAVAALVLAGCGGGGNGGGGGDNGGGGGGSGSGSSSQQQTSTSGGGEAQPASAQGKQVFTQNCGSCHTLKDAGTKGQVGPNLDTLKPNKPTVRHQVLTGGGPMPSFKGKLS
ncbi:MAG TPA: cytochrome c, partial [Kineosporiaceae bacterium]|nr:cytochrome c [Kineosporiaceae bacterium]